MERGQRCRAFKPDPAGHLIRPSQNTEHVAYPGPSLLLRRSMGLFTLEVTVDRQVFGKLCRQRAVPIDLAIRLGLNLDQLYYGSYSTN